MEKASIAWEQEIYEELKYITIHENEKYHFHTFEAGNGMAGLAFADKQEADTFLSEVKWV